MNRKKRPLYFPHQPGRTERRISVFILLVLAGIAILVLWRQSSFDLTRYGVIGSSAAKSGSQSVNSVRSSFRLPEIRSLAPPGYEPAGKGERYDADNLFEKIDGKAPLYLEAGFRNLVAQRFVDRQEEGRWIEVLAYDMGLVTNAFSVYSRQMRPDAVLIALPDFSCRSANALFMVRGGIYLEIIGSKGDEKTRSALLIIGRRIGRGGGERPPIPELTLFRGDRLVAGSEKLYLKNAFGYSGWSNVYTAKYKSGSAELTVYFSRNSSAQEAKKSADAYIAFLKGDGGKELPAGANPPGLAMISYLGSIEAVFVINDFVAGVHEAEDQQRALKISALLAENLKRRKGDE